MGDQRYGTGLSQETKLKIDEFKMLVYKYRQYQNYDPDEIVRLIVYHRINGDNKILDENLEHLRLLDSLANRRF
jgi:ABC-type Fe2+-enterobactin transport system substrate-binding protein